MILIYNLMLIFTGKWHRLKTVFWYRFLFKKIGKYCVIINPLKITPESIILGDRVSIGNNARIEGVQHYEDKKFDPKIILNDGVTIQQNIHLTCAESIEIGENTAIAANVTITDIHHPYDDIHLPIERQNITTKPVYIGEECKIYNNVVIMQGTKIGKHCTIGANSIVSGYFDDYCVIVGAPAKIVKKYNSDTKIWEKI